MKMKIYKPAFWFFLALALALPLEARDAREVLEEAKQAVVMVTTYFKGEACGHGSGFVVDPKGVIVTNFHVIEGSDKAWVLFPDGAKYPVRGVSGYDPLQDMAVLKIDATHLPALKLGDSDKIPVGSRLVAVGHPDGIEHSVEEGRLVTRRSYGTLGEYMQISVRLEPGYSGGALLDVKGNAVGILTATDRAGHHRSLAVPINKIKPLLKIRKIVKLGEVSGSGKIQQKSTN